jgi:hypothetical protein
MRGKRAKDIRREMEAQGYPVSFNRRLYRRAKRAYTLGKL